jgi:hypothetical protein
VHRHQDAAFRRPEAFRRVPVVRVAAGQSLRREGETGFDLRERTEKPAFIEFDRPPGVEVHQIIRALAAADRIARFLQHSVERRHVEVDLVAGLLLVAVDYGLETSIPRRGIDLDRDRHLLAGSLRGGGRMPHNRECDRQK